MSCNRHRHIYDSIGRVRVFFTWWWKFRVRYTNKCESEPTHPRRCMKSMHTIKLDSMHSMKLCTLLSQRASFIGYAFAHGGKKSPLFAPSENVLREGSRRKKRNYWNGKTYVLPKCLCLSPKTRNRKTPKKHKSQICQDKTMAVFARFHWIRC